MLATRVAQERQGPLGQEVGYQIRFEKVISSKTRIRFVTEGILLRQMIQDPMLKGVQAIVFDEFHERHLYGDITLARAMDLQSGPRPDLKILVMSATLETRRLSEYLQPCEALNSEGRTYPVDIRYLKPGQWIRTFRYGIWLRMRSGTWHDREAEVMSSSSCPVGMKFKKRFNL